MNGLMGLVTAHWSMLALGTVVYFIIGMVWYAPFLFWSVYAKHVKMTKTDKDGMTLTMVYQFILTIVTMVTILALWYGMGGTAMAKTVDIAALYLGFVGTKELGNHLFGKRPLPLIWLDLAYNVVSIAVVCWVLSMWG